jgi:hypothetical protein
MRSFFRATLVCLAASSTALAGNDQCGVNLPLWNSDIDMTQLNQSLEEFKNDGGRDVSVNVVWFQDNINSTVIQPNFSLYSASDTTVINTIDAAEALGLNVTLKPMVDLSDDPTHWRGQIVGGTTWFNAPTGYCAFAEHFATIAAETNVAMFDIGTELEGTVTQTSNWLNVISDVKSIYSGKLTYSANGGGSAIQTPVGFWSSLDYIGIDAYYSLTNQNDPSLSALQSAWTNQANSINSWWNGLPAAQQKPVLFTEVGYCSQQGTNIEPWNSSQSSVADPTEQANCYRALFSTLWNNPAYQSWFKGTYLWNWDVTATPNDPLGYTPQGKPAEGVMASYYRLPGDANLDGKVDINDLTIVLTDYGKSGMVWSQGDLNGDSKVDINDLTIVLTNYGNTAGASAAGLAAVPEPGTLILLAAGLLGILAHVWRKQ